MTDQINPLRAYFRQPAIYIRLPSNGQFWADNSINTPENNEYPVYPMTAIDEINQRNPDALFNGESIVRTIQSCLPNIVDAWQTPSIDINSILTAIRIASYGHKLDMVSACPECQEQNDFELDLRTLLDSLKIPDYSQTVKHGELEIYFRPMTLQQQNQVGIEQYETQRTINNIQNSTMEDAEKIKAMNNIMQNINKNLIAAMSKNINGIRSPAGFVHEPEYILEFLNNTDRKVFESVRDLITDLRVQSDFPPVKLRCTKCEKDYDQTIDLNISNFFESAS